MPFIFILGLLTIGTALQASPLKKDAYFQDCKMPK